MIEHHLDHHVDHHVDHRLDHGPDQRLDRVLDHLADDVLDLMSEGVTVQDLDGRFVRWNAAALRILGLTAPALAERNSIDPRWRAVHADGSDWPGDTHPAMITIYSGAPVAEERIGFHRPDGSLVWLRMRTHPIADATGAMCAVVSLFADVTEEHDQAASHAAAEARFRRTFERSPVGQLVVGPGGAVLDANLAVAEMLGRTIAELLALDVFALASLDVSPQLSAALLSPAPEEAVAAPIDFRRPDGEIRRGLVQVFDIEWPDVGRCSMVQVVDITELVQSKIASERSLRALRGAFESSPIGMAVVNPHGFVQEANPAFARLLARQAHEIVGIPLDLVVHDEDLDMVKRFAMKSAERSSVALEHRVVRADGEIRWLRTHWSRMDTDAGPRLLAQSLDNTAERRRDVLLSTVDALTGLLTRDGLVTALEDHVFSHPVSADEPLTLLVFDIDGFQRLNERLGAHGADQVLRRLAATISASLPPDVHVARVGADVFVALAVGMDRTSAERACERIRSRFGEVQPGVRGPSDPVGLRTGSLHLTQLDASPADVVQRAEATVRRTTPVTRPRAGWAAPSLVDVDADRDDAAGSWADAIEDALRRQHLAAVAEPLLWLHAGAAPRRYELLVRLVLADRTQLPLPKFERLAQRLGHGGAIDQWMAQRALHLLRAAAAADLDLELEVNLAPATFGDPGFLRGLAERISHLGVEPNRLLLAVTERSVLDDMTRALDFLDAAHELGVRVGIDDVGLVQSGRYLATARCAQVKFSGQLVRGAVEGRAERAMLATLTAMAKDVGAQVAAPFVHDLAMLDLLRELDVDFAQGRLVGGPVPSDEILAVH